MALLNLNKDRIDYYIVNMHRNYKTTMYINDYINYNAVSRLDKDSDFWRYFKDGIKEKLTANSNNIYKIQKLNEELFFLNTLSQIPSNLKLYIISTMKETGLFAYRKYAEMVMEETSSLYYFYSTIDKFHLIDEA